MVSRTPAPIEDRPEDPETDPFENCKPLTGVCLTIAKHGIEPGEKTTVLGIVMAANSDKLKECLQAIHAEQLVVQMRFVKPAQIRIKKEGQDA